MRYVTFFSVALLLPAITSAAVPVRVFVDGTERGHAVSPLLHGLFFEDINYGADGGLYAELIQNRSFEHQEHLYGWGIVARGGQGDVRVTEERALNGRNPFHVQLSIRDPGKGYGVANGGFGGIAVNSGEDYLVSLYVRRAENYGGTLRVALEDETGRPLGECKFRGFAPDKWQKHEGAIKSTGTTSHGRLVVLADAPGEIALDVISLFPAHTFKNRRNGVRADLAEMLVQLHPAFLRFPGGCIVEGKDLPTRYQWKDSIGDIAERPQNSNRWQDAIRGQTAPQYYQTYGLGFFEYFQLCEDLGCAAVPILNCGMACQYQSKQLVPIDQLDPFVQDALDLIEFANGPTDSRWGAKRAAMGHAAPFGLKMIGIGNEQWGEDYFGRYQVFQAALHARYPEIQIVSTAGPGVDNTTWQLAWDKFRHGTAADIVDEHYYRPPQWFLENATRYDAQPRTGPRIFAGEFAAHDGRGRRSTLRAAIVEAAFMTGLVRNSDVVVMSSYAPLFAKAGATQWQPDLIWFDNTRVYGTPSYHVQALFAQNRPDHVVTARVEGEAIALPSLNPADVSTYGVASTPPYRPAALPPLFVAAGAAANDIVVVLANPFSEPRAAQIEVRGAGAVATATVLTASDADAVNSFEHPHAVAPTTEAVKSTAGTLTRTLPAWSLTVIRCPFAR